MAKSPYEILGVRPGSSQDEIKKAYRTLVKQYHPDNYKDHPLESLAKEKMQEINEAYDQLTQPARSNPFYGSPGNQQQNQPPPWQSGQQPPPHQRWQNPQSRGPYYQQRGSATDDLCNTLSCLCCADTCCGCMGGDLCGC